MTNLPPNARKAPPAAFTPPPAVVAGTHPDAPQHVEPVAGSPVAPLWDMGLAMPKVTRVGAGRTAGGALDAVFAHMPLGASYLERVPVPEMADKTEQETAFKEACRKASNRLSGMSRRFTKKNPDKAFRLFSVADETLGFGVRVYRVEPAAKTEGEATTGA